MELANIKLDLAKKLLNTNDKELLNYIKAVLDTQPASETWYEDLPDRSGQMLIMACSKRIKDWGFLIRR